VIERLRDAINAHDPDAMAGCFDPDYDSTFPAHPDRAFQGSEQMRRNWMGIIGGVPNLRATLVRCSVDGETAWAEWDWQGTGRDGEPFHMRGVTVQGVRDGRIVWVRLYMEPVQEGPGVDEAIRRSVRAGAE
jgi:ketosteroid isomerase-like protein